MLFIIAMDICCTLLSFVVTQTADQWDLSGFKHEDQEEGALL